MASSEPIFRSREQFAEAVEVAGVDAETCVWVATTKLVDPIGLGIDIGSEDVVRRAYAEVGNEPGSVRVTNPGSAFKCAVTIGCALCEQEVMIWGPCDAQKSGTLSDPNTRKCLVWEYAPAPEADPPTDI